MEHHIIENDNIIQITVKATHAERPRLADLLVILSAKVLSEIDEQSLPEKTQFERAMEELLINIASAQPDARLTEFTALEILEHAQAIPFLQEKISEYGNRNRRIGLFMKPFFKRHLTDKHSRSFYFTKRECAKGAIYTLRFLAAEPVHVAPSRTTVTSGPGFTHWRDFQPLHG